MKRLLTFFLFTVFVLSANAQENHIWFPLDVVTLDFGAPKEYTQEIWYEGSLPGGGTYYGALPNPDNYRDDYDYSAQVLSGDLVVTSVGYVSGQKGVKVIFTGSKGAIEITATANGRFDGNLYSCSYILYYGNTGKRWDFNESHYDVNGWYYNWWDSWRHMYNNDNHPGYQPYKYALSYDSNPADLIPNAAGLKFVTEAYSFGYSNYEPDHHVNSRVGWRDDPTSDANIEYRFICFKGGSKIIVPASILKNYSNPRIRIKMGRDGHTTLNLIINNAYDAVGKLCCAENGYYGIGGCSWWGWHDDAEHRNKYDYVYRGEYQFQIVDKNQDFSIEIPTWAFQDQSSDWLMLYTLEVYDSEEMITENSILGDNYQFLTTQYKDKNGNLVTDSLSAPANFYIHYRGKGEVSSVSNCTVSGTVGTVGSKTGNNFIQRFVTSGETEKRHLYTPEKGEYGTFRIRLEVNDHNGNYITDYAYRTMSCGVLENKIYPYTWDLTDIKNYQNSLFRDDNGNEPDATNKMAKEATMGYALQPASNHLTGVTYIPRNLWEEDGSLRVANEAGNYNVMFCDGSQLWYGNTIIPEAAGLGFQPNNFDGQYNGALTLTDGGLQFNQDIRNWWKWRVVVPQVDNTCTIYVRAKKLVSNDFYVVGYKYCKGLTGNKDGYLDYKNSTDDLDGSARLVATVGDDVIYAIPGPSTTQNVTLFFNGLEVHKIAVSTDPKVVNKYGWATESRDHVIDQELTSYFTGKPFETITVESVDYSKKEVGLARVTMTERVMKKANLSDNSNKYNAYIIHNTSEEGDKDKKNVDILETGKGFHLFVPDIHDYLKDNEKYPSADAPYNLKKLSQHQPTMMAVLEKGALIPQTNDDDGTTNFVLTWQVADVEEGQQGDTYDFGYVGFFRVQAAGVTSKGNQGYLPVATSQSNGINKFNLVWDDNLNGIDDTIITNTAVVNDNVFYNLNGQKIDGVPTQRGLYIFNGKKIVVK